MLSGAIDLRPEGIEIKAILSPQTNESRRKTKIVCTLGPACNTQEKIGQLIDAGMNVARLNFSHGDHNTHLKTLNELRAALSTRPHRSVAVLLDTKGPEIRSGFLSTPDKKATFERGSTVELTTDYSFLGNASRLACSYKELTETVKPGQRILIGDGALILEVQEIRASDDIVVTKAVNTATIGERKNMNLPGCIVKLPTLTPKDEEDLINFGLAQGIDFIAASFVRTAGDIQYIRKLLGARGRAIKIIAKIENQEGLENYDRILEETDAIMVARGDLGMEVPPEKVFLAQKMMIRKANIAGKPIVTATQMLDSMIHNPGPTRAECTDVANAVLDGSDCVMLSGETANGDFPIESVTTMSRICVQAEETMHYGKLQASIKHNVLQFKTNLSCQEAVCSSAVSTARDVNAKMIVVLTESGNTARLIAKYRPEQPVLVLTALREAARQAEGYLKGTVARVMGSMIGTDSILFRASDIGKQLGWVESGDVIVAVHGMQEAKAGSTNMIKVLAVE